MREFGAASYSNVPCAVESLVSTSLAWTKLHPDCVRFSCCSQLHVHPLQLLFPDYICFFLTASSSAAAARVCLLVITHTQYKIQYAHTSLQISSLCMLLHTCISLICWVGIFSSNKWPFASENWGWGYFWGGGACFRETVVHLSYHVQMVRMLRWDGCLQFTCSVWQLVLSTTTCATVGKVH